MIEDVSHFVVAPRATNATVSNLFQRDAKVPSHL